MPTTYEAKELARLPVPGSEGYISMQVKTHEGKVQTGETRWITLTFTQFAQIQNVLDTVPLDIPEDDSTFCDWCQTDPGPDGDCDCP